MFLNYVPFSGNDIRGLVNLKRFIEHGQEMSSNGSTFDSCSVVEVIPYKTRIVQVSHKTSGKLNMVIHFLILSENFRIGMVQSLTCYVVTC
jgi:hypothetical protein